MKYKILSNRNLVKTVSYRILSAGIGFLVMWYITGNIKIGVAFGVAEMLLKPGLYYLHERAWYRWIKFGVTVDKEPKKNTPTLTKNKIKPQVKVYEEEPIETPQPSPTPKVKSKKVLNYSSNR